MRILIIGNSGAGKSTLARQLAESTGAPAFDLDMFHWLPSGYGQPRDPAVAHELTAEAAAGPAWIIEGVFGWLAEIAAPRAQMLVWIDLPWDVCRDGLIARGLRRGATQAEFDALVAWAQDYRTRATSSSFDGHARIFEAFANRKIRMRHRSEITDWLDGVRLQGGIVAPLGPTMPTLPPAK